MFFDVSGYLKSNPERDIRCFGSPSRNQSLIKADRFRDGVFHHKEHKEKQNTEVKILEPGERIDSRFRGNDITWHRARLEGEETALILTEA